jgi:hypothetical protein
VWISFFSLPSGAGFFLWAIRFAISHPIARTPQRMTPVDATGSRWQRPFVVQVAMLLPQFVGKQKHDDQQRNHQKNPEYYVLVHDSLQLQEIRFNCRAPLVPAWGHAIDLLSIQAAGEGASRGDRLAIALSAWLCAPRFFSCIFRNGALQARRGKLAIRAGTIYSLHLPRYCAYCPWAAE